MSGAEFRPQVPPPPQADPIDYMTFMLGAEEYGVAIARVQEVRSWEKVTRIPNAPAYISGVLNLRGVIVPVIDLRLRLGKPFRAYIKETVVIIFRTLISARERCIGVVVDSICGVLSVAAAEIRQEPASGARQSIEFVAGSINSKGKKVMLLDVDSLPHRSHVDQETRARVGSTDFGPASERRG